VQLLAGRGGGYQRGLIERVEVMLESEGLSEPTYDRLGHGRLFKTEEVEQEKIGGRWKDLPRGWVAVGNWRSRETRTMVGYAPLIPIGKEFKRDHDKVGLGGIRLEEILGREGGKWEERFDRQHNRDKSEWGQEKRGIHFCESCQGTYLIVLGAATEGKVKGPKARPTISTCRKKKDIR